MFALFHSCSGDDGVNVSGNAQPTFHDCTLTGQKCGLRAFANSTSKLHRCEISGCGEQACKASNNASVQMTR